MDPTKAKNRNQPSSRTSSWPSANRWETDAAAGK